MDPTRKLILAVVDAMHPRELREAIAAGTAPNFGELVARGSMVDDCVSSFPSVTPVASSEILTGVGPGNHWVMGMNWFHRLERRYVEYGSSFEATRVFGIFRAMFDLVYNINLVHLSWEATTVFERLADAGLRTATTPFLIFRGRTRHELSLEGLSRRAAEAISFQHAVWGPKEFFYGDLYASRETECGSALTRPGARDEYSACAAAELIADDCFDFLLLSLPDNDFHSHRQGPEGQSDSIAKADTAFGEVVRAAGGWDHFLDRYAVILTSDHAHVPVRHALPLQDALAGEFDVLQPNAEDPEASEIAVCPTSRAAAVYLMHCRPDHAQTHAAIRHRLGELPGVDLAAWLEDETGPVRRPTVGPPTGPALRAVVRRGDSELHFAPSGPLTDRRGAAWSVSGDLGALEIETGRSTLDTAGYPDALSRLWSSLSSPHAGDVLVSLAPEWECADWGGASHVGGGSHGALAAEDSLSPLVFTGCGPADPGSRSQWALRDIPAVILGHFGVGFEAPDPPVGVGATGR